MKRITLTFISIIAITFMACQEDETGTDTNLDTEIALADLESEESFNYVDEDINDLTEAGMADISAFNGGRVEFEGRRAILKCAEVTHDTINQTIEIVYDSLSDCQNPFGHARHGKIVISYNDRRYVPGAFRSVSFEDFYMDDVKVEGTRKIENITGSTEDAPKFQITVTGGKLIFGDGTSIERDVDHIRTWLRAATPSDDSVTLEGNSSGKRRDDTGYTVTIVEALVFKRACRPQGFLPVSGIKEITSGERTMTIDFGDGTCDNLVDVTIDGVTETKEIKPRGFRK